MSKINKQILLFFLFTFAIYCALTIGQSWDEKAELLKGKTTLDYLFSLGGVDKEIPYREYFSPIYWSLLYFLTNIFPSQYEIEIGRLINLVFSLCSIFAIGKLSKELFNDKIGKLTFLILFFYPIYFGHMTFNNKDIILALSHIWITYLLLRYLKKQNIKDKINKYVVFIGVLAALATGIQLVFLGSLMPIILFFLLEIFFFKKFISKNFSKKKFFRDLIKCFIIFYLLLIFFWIDTYPNIFVLPFNFLIETLSPDYQTGWPYNLLNGNFYLSKEVPKSYFLISFIYKSPEYLLISYLIFLILILKSKTFFKEKFKFFNYKLSLIICILIFPNLILFFIPYPVYDGLRLFLWTLPYFCIIPGLSIYYLIENLDSMKSKLAFLLLSVFIIYFLFNFFSITPYQYTYLNVLNGKIESRYKKFENDYWGTSIGELVKYANFETKEIIKISTCGINSKIAEDYIEGNGYSNFQFVSPEKSEYIIMTNRVTFYDVKTKNFDPINCFDKFKGDNIFKVKRNGLLLSAIKKIPNN